jgi:UDP-N-acetylmuramoyl-tripeptide--D-alanyl-D-alanine ligase
MTAQFTGEEIIEITGGRLAAGMLDDDAGSICTDSRQVKEGCWYIALSGERFDGHDFLGDAFSAGALGAIVAERTGYSIGNPQFPLIAVDNTLEAYHALARNWRRRINPFVVGVTGSSGKTTTKEMCAAVFSSALRTHKSAQNENNEFGVPKTILSMPDDTQALIIEMAMRGLGQIDQLARCALPDVGIITNAGTAHLELLGTVENIAKAKCELLAHLKKDRGVGIIGQPSEILMNAAHEVFSGKLLICDENAIAVDSVTVQTTNFSVNGVEGSFEVRAHGRPLLEDAWCAIMAAGQRNLTPDVIASGLRSFEPVGGRGNRLIGAGGALVLDETYNANPDSVRASVAALLDDRAFPQTTKIVVLGELAELGPTEAQLHQDLGRWLKDKPLGVLITVGRLARHIAEGAQGAKYEVLPCGDQSEAENALRSRLSTDACVLIKGSHRANLDKMVANLTAG